MSNPAFSQDPGPRPHYGGTWESQIPITESAPGVSPYPPIADYGFLHYHDVTNVRFAEKAAAGVDGQQALEIAGDVLGPGAIADLFDVVADELDVQMDLLPDDSPFDCAWVRNRLGTTRSRV